MGYRDNSHDNTLGFMGFMGKQGIELDVIAEILQHLQKPVWKSLNWCGAFWWKINSKLSTFDCRVRYPELDLRASWMMRYHG